VVEELQAIKEEANKEEFDEEDYILFTPNVRELLVIQRALHAKELPLESSQREQIFHIR